MCIPITEALHIALNISLEEKSRNGILDQYLYIFFNEFYLFFYFCQRWVFIAGHGLSLIVVSQWFFSCKSTGFSLRQLLSLGSTGCRARGLSDRSSRVLERRLSSCGAWAKLLHGVWNLPGPGIRPVSPALAGRFLTTGPPGRSNNVFYWAESGGNVP